MERSFESAPESLEGRPELAPEVDPNAYYVVVGIRPYNRATFLDVWELEHLPIASEIEGVDYVGLFRVDGLNYGGWPYQMHLGWPSKEAHDVSLLTKSRNAALEHIKTLGEIGVILRVEELITFQI